MAIRTKADIARDIKYWLQSRLRKVDTGSGTIVSSIMLEAIASALAGAYTALGVAETAQGLSDPVNEDTGDLDSVAYNLNLTRKSAVQATGFITFRKAAPPTTTMAVGGSDGSGGVLVGSGQDANGNSTTFVTTATVYFDANTALNPVTGYYEISAPIQALYAGTVGNQEAGSIQILVTAVNGVDATYNNVATTGGQDPENNAQLASRMASKILGLHAGVYEGLKTTAMAQSGVIDASVVGPNDSEFQRSTFGAVDIVIRGNSVTQAIDSYIYSGPTPHQFESSPVNDILSTVATVGLTQSLLTENLDYAFLPDTTSERRNSSKSEDKMDWYSENLPNPSSPVQITYSYNQLVKQIQDALDAEDAHYPTAQPLVKQASAVTIDLSFQVLRNSAVDSTTLRNQISTALSNYISALPLGSKISQSALVTPIRSVAGVRQLFLPFIRLARRGNTGTSDIQLTLYEYAQLDGQSLVISVVV